MALSSLTGEFQALAGARAMLRRLVCKTSSTTLGRTGLTCGALVVVAVWLAWLTGRADQQDVTAPMGLTCMVGMFWLAVRRARRDPDQRLLYLSIAWSAPLLTLPFLVSTPATLHARHPNPALLAWLAAVVFAYLVQHAALHAWRLDDARGVDATATTGTSSPPPVTAPVMAARQVDRLEVLIGLGAVLMMIALLNAAFALVPTSYLQRETRWALWSEVQMPLTAVAIAVVWSQSLLAVAVDRGTLSDTRIWLAIASALSTVAAGLDAVRQVLTGSSANEVVLGTGPGALVRSMLWPTDRSVVMTLLPLVLLVLAVGFPYKTMKRKTPPVHSAATLGAFAVLLAAVTVLTVAAVGYAAASDSSALPSEQLAPFGLTAAGLSCAAAALSATRLLLNVRHLTWFTLSQREALVDDLTGLANRRGLLRALQEVTSSRQALGLALLDLDRFKEVNDGLGHAAGDELLRQVAARLRTMPPAGAFEVRRVLARLGGDEFVVMVGVRAHAAPQEVLDQPRQAANAWGQRLVALFEAPFDLEGARVHVRASVGTTFCSAAPASSDRNQGGATDSWAAPAASRASSARTVAASAPTPLELLRRVDAAMYDAKAAGQVDTSPLARSVVYDPERHGGARSRPLLAEDLRTALLQGDLEVHYQPQVASSDGHLAGVEALVRWQHPAHGTVDPSQLVALAEAYGLMEELTEYVLGVAIAQAAAWVTGATRLEPVEAGGRGAQWRMSVNLSASSLMDLDLPERVADSLGRHALPASRLVLEVTESVLVANLERSTAVLQRLALLGVQISIDDFGTGYSSLTQLATIPADELKLDRAFTHQLDTDARTEAVVETSIMLAHRLGMRVVAEGVEDAVTFEHLRKMGCDVTQGWLHAPAMPADELSDWCSRRDVPIKETVATPKDHLSECGSASSRLKDR